MSRPHPTRAQREQLAPRIEAELARAPRSAVELADMLGFSHHAIRLRLNAMRDEDTAHFVTMRTFDGIGLTYVWHLGPAPEGQVVVCRRVALPVAPAVEELPIRRDPLVEALFGPARRGES